MISIVGRTIAFALAGMLGTVGAWGQTFSTFRYDDNAPALASAENRTSPYARLKYISFGDEGEHFLSFGLDDRERVEASSNRLLALGSNGVNGYELHRTLVFADLHLGWIRAFAQLGDQRESGRAPTAIPTDTNRGDLQQGFLDIGAPFPDGKLTLRAGRAEMSFDEGAMIGLRDGPNVRQSWDGFRGLYVTANARVDIFAVKPVGVSPGSFDDHDLPRQSLWGAHLDLTSPLTAPFSISAFYYGSKMPLVLFSPKPGEEQSHSVGLRIKMVDGGWDGSVGMIAQAGVFANKPVRAGALHGDVGWTLTVPGTPRLGLRADVLTGGDGAGHVVHDFNALYPNYAYSTEATIEAPANLIQPGFTVRIGPASAVTIQYVIEGLWRFSTKDAFYAAPLFPLVKPDGTKRRYSGLEQQIRAEWLVDRFVTLTAAYVHFDPGVFIRSSGGRSEDFGMAEVAFRF